MSLTPELCSVHVHTTLCDGRDTPEAMAAAALAAGVRHLGFSCHSHTPIPDDEGAVLPADMTAYRETVLRLREQYAGRMEILLGLEWDSQSDMSPAGFDYWIGSVHYQKGPNGRYYAADWGPEHFAACRDELFAGDPLAVTEGYFAEAARVAARKPTILGHFDLITKLNAGTPSLTRTPPGTGRRHWRPSTPETPPPLCWRSTPAAWPGATGTPPTPPSSCCGRGGPWAGGSSSPPTPTAPPTCSTATVTPPGGPGRRALTGPWR